jgi:hypothetical protein
VLDQGADGVGAEEHRLFPAARVQHTVGEDMAALGVGAELDLVDRQEIDRSVDGHRFDGADKPARVGRDDLFFAGDQGHGARALGGSDAIVVLAREQPQGKSDHPAGMTQHAIDREMGLAGIRGAQNGPYAARREARHGFH